MFKCTCRNVSVQVQVWKCQCVSVSVEVSVFKGFSGRTLRNAFGKKFESGGHCRMRMPHEEVRVCFRFAMLPLRCFACSRFFITAVWATKHLDRKRQLHPTNHKQASTYQEPYCQCFTQNTCFLPYLGKSRQLTEFMKIARPICFSSRHATPW